MNKKNDGKYWGLGLTVVVALALTAGCDLGLDEQAADLSDPVTEPVKTPKEAAARQTAEAVLEPTEENEVRGKVTFLETDGGVRVVAELEGLKPGMHGMHIHENGDCSAHDGSSAGGHFNPTQQRHGSPDSAEHHIGDLGNISANESGRATVDITLGFLKLKGDHSIVGRSLVVHAQPDDFVSQPSGDAGARVACGTILSK